jgi:hypothetical protein
MTMVMSTGKRWLPSYDGRPFVLVKLKPDCLLLNHFAEWMSPILKWKLIYNLLCICQVRLLEVYLCILIYLHMIIYISIFSIYVHSIVFNIYNNSIIIYSFDLICVGPSWVNYWIIPSRIKHRLRKMPHFPSKLGCLGLLEHRKHQILNQSHSSWTTKTMKNPIESP